MMSIWGNNEIFDEIEQQQQVVTPNLFFYHDGGDSKVRKIPMNQSAPLKYFFLRKTILQKGNPRQEPVVSCQKINRETSKQVM